MSERILPGAARPATVYLVGAGPGDPGLLTVRARTLLDACDAVVHDALVAPELIALLGARPRPPEIHFVGKRGGDDASASQEAINQVLVSLARAGKSVVRLKGGDPFVFGRGSEEAQVLAQAGIAFEVVPGVTAGIAGPAYAGIPVTHRGMATAVTFVTGHEDPTKPSAQTDWPALARSGSTIVLYMGLRRLPTIVRALVSGGLSPDTPAACIQWATTARQQTVDGTLTTIVERAHAAGLDAPVITVIGDVVALRPGIRWFDRGDARPLLGRRVLVTRAAAQSSALSDPLRALGAAVTEMPATRIEILDAAPLRRALTGLHAYRFIVFTSPQAVKIVWDGLWAMGCDARALAGLTVAAIGPATARTLLEHGVRVDVSPRRFVAEGLLEALDGRSDVSGARVLYPAAAGARDVLADGLRARGVTVDEVPIYASVTDTASAASVREAIAARALDLVTFTSASSVRGYVEAVGEGDAVRLPAASIGPVTSEAAKAVGIPVVAEAEESSIPGLIEAVLRTLSTGRSATLDPMTAVPGRPLAGEVGS